jgi:hypothetical protein
MTVRRTTELLVPLAPALLLFVVLAAFVAVDPPIGFTSSSSPFSDDPGRALVHRCDRNTTRMGRPPSNSMGRAAGAIVRAVGLNIGLRLAGAVIQAVTRRRPPEADPTRP